MMAFDTFFGFPMDLTTDGFTAFSSGSPAFAFAFAFAFGLSAFGFSAFGFGPSLAFLAGGV